MGFTISFPARSICSIEIGVVQQRLASKIEVLRAHHSWDAAETFCDAPGGDGFID